MKVEDTENNFSKSLIIRSNSLIEASYKLSLQESRVILWLLSQIDSTDEDFKRYYLDIKKFAEITGLSVDNQYAQLKKITKNLTKQSLDIYEPQKQTILHACWLSAAFYELTKGYVALEFSPYLKPYLLKIRSHFTTIRTGDLLKLKSVYSIRIFELLKQYENIGRRRISIEKLRSYCGVKPNQYRNYNAVKIYIIERAANEINDKTEYEIDYTEIKESRKFIAIEWTIKKKNLNKEALSNQINILRQELRSELALVESLIEYGYSKASAKKFVKDYGETVVRDAVTAVDIQVDKGGVRNAKAMLRTAIIEHWKPDVFKMRSK